jgi:hypothetical protein
MSDNYSTNLTAIINYAISQGWVIPSNTMLNNIDIFINSLVSLGLWNKFDVFYMFSYNDTTLTNFARINWKNPGLFTISINGTPLYTINGFKKNSGYTGYNLNTNFIPSVNGVNYTLNDASLTKYFGESFNVLIPLGGGGPPYPKYSFWTDGVSSSETIQSGTTKVGQAWSWQMGLNGGFTGGLSAITQLPPLKIITINRISSGLIDLYTDGILLLQATLLSTTLSNQSFRLIDDEIYTGGDYTFNLFGLGASLNLTNNVDLKNSYNTFKTSIGL